jgi:hypothetical protein
VRATAWTGRTGSIGWPEHPSRPGCWSRRASSPPGSSVVSPLWMVESCARSPTGRVCGPPAC